MGEFLPTQVEALDIGRANLWPGGVVFVCAGVKGCPNLADGDEIEPCPVCYPVEYDDPRPSQVILDTMVKDIH